LVWLKDHSPTMILGGKTAYGSADTVFKTESWDEEAWGIHRRLRTVRILVFLAGRLYLSYCYRGAPFRSRSGLVVSLWPYTASRRSPRMGISVYDSNPLWSFSDDVGDGAVSRSLSGAGMAFACFHPRQPVHQIHPPCSLANSPASSWPSSTGVSRSLSPNTGPVQLPVFSEIGWERLAGAITRCNRLQGKLLLGMLLLAAKLPSGGVVAAPFEAVINVLVRGPWEGNKDE
jgi:hypothetical protein